MAKINIQFPVKNAGNIKATNVIGTVTEPSDVSFIKATTLKGTYNNTSKEWTIPTLLAGEEAQLNLQFNIDDFESFPFEFAIDFTSDQDPDADPTNNSKTVIINEEDVFPCPDCPPPSVDLEDVEWSKVVVDLGIDNNCLGCDLEVELVPLSEDNVESVEIDSEKGIAKVVLEDPFEDWSFQIEANCINCPYWCGESNSYGPFGPKTIFGTGTCCTIEESVDKLPKYDTLDEDVLFGEGLREGDLFMGREGEGHYSLYVFQETED